MTERLNSIYTPLEEAVATLRARKSEMAKPPGTPLELCLMQRPHAVLFRQVATPNFEMDHFVSLATSAGLAPLILEFHGDLFVHCNPAKYALARMTFHFGIGRNGGSRNQCLTIADITQANGKPLRGVKTLWGEGLVTFHRNLMTRRAFLPAVDLHDGTDWFQSKGGGAKLYYPHLFELFIEHAILFENFLITPREMPFTAEIILPAFECIYARRGLRPLVCRLDPLDAEGDPYWLQYPGELLPEVQKISVGKTI